MKVAILLVSAGIGGTEQRIAEFSRRLTSAGYDVTLLANRHLVEELGSTLDRTSVGVLPDWPSSLYAGLNRSGLPTASIARRVCFLYGSSLIGISQLDAILRTLRPDVLHLLLTQSMVAAAALQLSKRLPTVVSLVGSEIRHLAPAPDPLSYWVTKRSLLSATHVDALSEELLAKLKGFPWAERIPASVHLPAVDTETNRPSAIKYKSVVFAGRLIPEKNPLLFVEAIPLVLQRMAGANVKFHVLGKGPLEKEVLERVRALGIADTVEVGFARDISTTLSQSMVFTSLQRNENYPSRSLLEAMACGNAIIATDVGYTHYLVNETTGIRVKPRVDELASAICALIEDEDRSRLLGANGRQMIQARFSWDRYVSELLDVYRVAIASFGRDRR